MNFIEIKNYISWWTSVYLADIVSKFKIPAITWLDVCMTTFTIAALYVLASKHRFRPLGYLIGVISQIFWLIYCYQNPSYGIIIISVVHMVIWVLGVRNYTIPYLKSELKNETESES